MNSIILLTTNREGRGSACVILQAGTRRIALNQMVRLRAITTPKTTSKTVDLYKPGDKIEPQASDTQLSRS
jgi:hypothetical protein